MLVFQADGNLVLSRDVRPTWSTQTQGSGANVAKIQEDDNFVVGLKLPIGDSIFPNWSTGTHTPDDFKPGPGAITYLRVFDNGDLRLYMYSPVGTDGIGRLLWSSRTGALSHDAEYESLRKSDAEAKARTAAYNAKWEEDHKSWLEKAARSTGRAIGTVTHALADVSSSLADTLGDIPLIGPGLKGLYGYSYGAFFSTADNIAQGVRIDKVVSRHFDAQVQNVKEVAPYVQTVIAIVPGVGPGISAGISAGLSLAQGHDIDQVLIDAAVGAIPGGPMAQAGVKIGIAAAQGKPVIDAAIDAVPTLPPQAKQAAKAAFHVVKDIADGKRVDRALLAEADKQLQALPPEFRKAAQVGIALGQGQRLQEIAKREVPALTALGGQLASVGQGAASTDAVITDARKLSGGGSHGFDVASGLMKYQTSPVEMVAARNALSAIDQRGFDMAAALHLSRVTTKPLNIKIDSKIKVGYHVLAGMAGGAAPQKQAIAKVLIADPKAKIGAGQALLDITRGRVALVHANKTLWQSIKEWFLGSPIDHSASPAIQLAQANAALRK